MEHGRIFHHCRYGLDAGGLSVSAVTSRRSTPKSHDQDLTDGFLRVVTVGGEKAAT
jgi:hypothetical protein